MVECTECGAELKLECAGLNELVECSECSSEMEVISINPLKVEKAPTEQEDWGE